MRDLASSLYVRAKAVQQARDQDAALFAVIEGLDGASLTEDAASVRELILGDFRAEGAHLGDEARAELATVNERISSLTTAFSENIRDAQASIRIAPERLAGLPDDYIAEHPVGDDGLVEITTSYPDKFPFMEMAHDADARRDLLAADYRRAYPANDAVLADLLAARNRKAELLGLPSFADVATQRMMMPDGDSIGRFIDEVNEAARPAALRDAERLLERKRKDFPDASTVTVYDSTYYTERIKAEELGVDSNEVRKYLDFPKIRQGVLDLTAELFGFTYVPVADAPRWHPDVDVFDVMEDGDAVGRIYLDMHPREGKFSHMACFPIASGFTGRNVPESALLCNFPRGLMTFDDVVTFLHEFGHLVHEICSGQQVWARCSGLIEQQEWDFVEAPSQMLEEWAWRAPILAALRDQRGRHPHPHGTRRRAARGARLLRGPHDRKAARVRGAVAPPAQGPPARHRAVRGRGGGGVRRSRHDSRYVSVRVVWPPHGLFSLLLHVSVEPCHRARPVHAVRRRQHARYLRVAALSPRDPGTGQPPPRRRVDRGLPWPSPLDRRLPGVARVAVGSVGRN